MSEIYIPKEEEYYTWKKGEWEAQRILELFGETFDEVAMLMLHDNEYPKLRLINGQFIKVSPLVLAKNDSTLEILITKLKKENAELKGKKNINLFCYVSDETFEIISKRNEEYDKLRKTIENTDFVKIYFCSFDSENLENSKVIVIGGK